MGQLLARFRHQRLRQLRALLESGSSFAPLNIECFAGEKEGLMWGLAVIKRHRTSP